MLLSQAEHENEESTFRLLQLILACAVNCDNKQTYIQTIMGMEETVQQAIMEAIQQVCVLILFIVLKKNYIKTLFRLILISHQVIECTCVDCVR